MTINVVHGIHTHDGLIYKFGKSLEEMGHTVRYYPYPKRRAISMYSKKKMMQDGSGLAHFMNDGDHIVAHSNGGLVWQNSISCGAKWDKCFLFSPACTSDKFDYPEDSLNQAYIVYNPEDTALKLGALLPGHPFGKLGLIGYQGQPRLMRGKKDRRFHNINGFSNKRGLNHSHYWKEENRDSWLKFVDAKIKGGRQ